LYNDTISRLVTLLSDFIITCNTQETVEAFDVKKKHAYLFSEGARLHAEDNGYNFYKYGFGIVNSMVAEALLGWIAAFNATGNPNGTGDVPLPVHGENHTMALLSTRGLGILMPDHARKEWCAFWYKTLYY
jgi:hypothetical protein